MSSRGWLAVFVAALVMPLCAAVPASAATSWDGGTGSLGHQCGADRVVSLAPLGPDAHALRWRACYVDLRNPILGTRCLSYVEDVVFTG